MRPTGCPLTVPIGCRCRLHLELLSARPRFGLAGKAAQHGFDELQELTTRAGDKRSLAIGMAGYLTTLAFMSHHREASQLASEFATLVELIGDRVMTVGRNAFRRESEVRGGREFRMPTLCRNVSSNWPTAMRQWATSWSRRHWLGRTRCGAPR